MGGAERSVPGMEHETNNLLARVAGLEALVARLEANAAAQARQMELKDRVLLDQIDRIAELERALEDAHRRSKRQTAPFSKGDPKETPKTPGRKSGEAHGRHGHRPVPAGPPDRDLAAPLPEACPDCGGRISHDRDEEQWQGRCARTSGGHHTVQGCCRPLHWL